MRVKVLLICFLLAGCCYAETAKPPINLYGVWMCYRYFEGEVEGGGSSDAKKAIGEKIDFEKGCLKFSRKNSQSFLCFPKDVIKNATYEWKKVKLFIGDYAEDKADYDDLNYLALWKDGPKKEEDWPSAYLLNISSEKDHYVSCFELTINRELAYYYNGQVFFFRRIYSSDGEAADGFSGWMKRFFK